jgi:uncharacterized RmlC-like cupin family protein
MAAQTDATDPAGAPASRCVLIRTGATYAGKQHLTYFEGVSRQSAGSQALCLHLLTIPPGGRAKAHYHATHETAIYVLQGQAENLYGERLEHQDVLHAGDFYYIPAGVPHIAINLSQTEPCTAIIARTDPNEQESVVLRPDLDELAERLRPRPPQA